MAIISYIPQINQHLQLTCASKWMGNGIIRIRQLLFEFFDFPNSYNGHPRDNLFDHVSVRTGQGIRLTKVEKNWTCEKPGSQCKDLWKVDPRILTFKWAKVFKNGPSKIFCRLSSKTSCMYIKNVMY